MTSLWAALFAEALVLFAVAGFATGAVRNRLRIGSTVAAATDIAAATVAGAVPAPVQAAE